MRKVYLLLLLSFTSVCVQAQTTVFSDNFNTSQGNAYTIATGPIGISPDWSLLNLADFGAKIDNNILDLTNDGSGGGNGLGFAYAHAQTSAFAAPFNTTLNLNPGLVTWTFNMRQIQANPGGFTIGNFGVGFILGATGGLNGYGVLLGQAGTTDPVRLVSFTGTVGSFTDLIISNTVGLNDFGNEY